MADQDGDDDETRQSHHSGCEDDEDHYKLKPAFRSLLCRIIDDIDDRQSLDAFTETQLHWVLDAAIEVLKPLPALIQVDVPVVLFGDIHGQLADLQLFLQHVGRPPTTKLLFLGDYADRGGKGLEVLFMLLALKLLHPRHVDLLRGNHETALVNCRYGLLQECRHKFSLGVWTKLRDLFFELPLCARVGKRVLAMHGGLSETLNTWDDFAQLKKCQNEGDDETPPAVDLMWADPSKREPSNGQMFKFNKDRGISVKFGAAAVKQLINNLDVDLIVRAHQVPSVKTGYELLMDDRLCTIFSAPCYGGYDNSASVMHISGELKIHFTILRSRLSLSKTNDSSSSNDSTDTDEDEDAEE